MNQQQLLSFLEGAFDSREVARLIWNWIKDLNTRLDQDGTLLVQGRPLLEKLISRRPRAKEMRIILESRLVLSGSSLQKMLEFAMEGGQAQLVKALLEDPRCEVSGRDNYCIRYMIREGFPNLQLVKMLVGHPKFYLGQCLHWEEFACAGPENLEWLFENRKKLPVVCVYSEHNDLLLALAYHERFDMFKTLFYEEPCLQDEGFWQKFVHRWKKERTFLTNLLILYLTRLKEMRKLLSGNKNFGSMLKARLGLIVNLRLLRNQKKLPREVAFLIKEFVMG